MGIDLNGDWDRFSNLENLDNAFKNFMGDALEVGAETIRGNIVKGIRDQRFHFVPLAESTKKQKERQGKSPLILIREGDYLASFTTEKIDWDEVHLGTNHAQARAIEMGYEPGNQPARPHVEPGIEMSLDEYGQILEKAFYEMFNSL